MEAPLVFRGRDGSLASPGAAQQTDDGPADLGDAAVRQEAARLRGQADQAQDVAGADVVEVTARAALSAVAVLLLAVAMRGFVRPEE